MLLFFHHFHEMLIVTRQGQHFHQQRRMRLLGSSENLGGLVKAIGFYALEAMASAAASSLFQKAERWKCMIITIHSRLVDIFQIAVAKADCFENLDHMQRRSVRSDHFLGMPVTKSSFCIWCWNRHLKVADQEDFQSNTKGSRTRWVLSRCSPAFPSSKHHTFDLCKHSLRMGVAQGKTHYIPMSVRGLGKLKADGHHISDCWSALAEIPMSFVVLVGNGSLSEQGSERILSEKTSVAEYPDYQIPKARIKSGKLVSGL